MFAPEFASAYVRQKAYVPHAEDPLQERVLQENSEWDQNLGDQLLAYLSGNSMSRDEATAFIDKYQTWITYSFQQKMQRIVGNFHDDTPVEEVTDFYGRVSQHLLNMPLGELWVDVLSDTTPSRRTITNAQINLAATCMQLMAPVREVHVRGALFKWQSKGTKYSHYKVADPISLSLMSVAAEIDTAVAALDAVKDHTGAVVLPAPNRFEHSVTNSGRNIDLVTIDMHAKNAHGLQVKLSRRSHFTHTEYDERYVTVVDSEQDLKNVLFIRRPNGSASSPVPMPGLYSAHFLAAQKKLYGQYSQGKTPSLTNRSNTLMRAKIAAMKFTELAPSANPTALERMSEIAIRDLELR